jgi:hypothetical protein
MKTVTRAQFLAAVEPKDWWFGAVDLGDFVRTVLGDETIDLTPRLMTQLEATLSGRSRTLNNLRRLAR